MGAEVRSVEGGMMKRMEIAPMDKSRDQDQAKGVVEQDQNNQGGNTSMNGQLGHRDQDVELKGADSLILTCRDEEAAANASAKVRLWSPLRSPFLCEEMQPRAVLLLHLLRPFAPSKELGGQPILP
jgi:hypothetical protein